MMPDRSERPRFHMLRLRSAVAPSTLVVIVSLVLAGAASVADAAKKAPADKTPPGSLLTTAQLRDCVTQKDLLHKQTDAALKDKADIAADKAEIERSGTALNELTAALDRTSAEAVDAYNAKVDVRDKLIDSYQAKVTAYNKEAEDVKATKEAYEKSCVDRRYDERDLKDLQRKK
ncbi:MAG: hypothetical protein ABJA61_02860 [Caldimonas sp.]